MYELSNKSIHGPISNLVMAISHMVYNKYIFFSKVNKKDVGLWIEMPLSEYYIFLYRNACNWLNFIHG